jgi:hypothetical protein
MLTDEEDKRIIETLTNSRNSNCIGTILYICGVIEKDEYVGLGEKRWIDGFVDNYLNTLVKLDEPKPGSIVVVRYKSLKTRNAHLIAHMGLIIEEDPLMVFERAGDRGKALIASLDEFLCVYNDGSLIEYYDRNNRK